jgi:hypothetical protein
LRSDARVWTCGVLLALLAAGCDTRDAPSAESPLSYTLTLDSDAQVPVGLTQLTKLHVEDLGPGDAQGSAAQGTYVTDSAASASFRCFCRVGSCDEALQQANAPSGVLDVQQSDGLLTIELTRPGYEGSCSGGISAEGALTCGKTVSDSDRHREFFRLSGQLGSASDGARVLDLELMVTRRHATAAGVVDCDTWRALTVREQR